MQPRKIRSFVRREGRITIAQRKALEELWPLYGLEINQGILDYQKTFARTAKNVLEIGFGQGDSLFSMAKAAPDSNFIGIEVHRPGVGALLAAIHQTQLSNVRIYMQDAVEILQHCIADNSLDTIQLFFPDPWHKKRHHKRRIIRADFLQLLHDKLKINGIFHMATDWQDYADYALNLLNNTAGFHNLSADNSFISRPASRPTTKFEKRGQRLGHSIYDMKFVKQ